MLLLLFRGTHSPYVPHVNQLYPLSGVKQAYPLSGQGGTYPLASVTQTYPLG